MTGKEKIMNINIPNNVLNVMHILEIFGGFQAFVVGGAVRDSIIGIPVNDWDVATDANPDQVISLFENHGFRVIETGFDHGTVTVMSDGEPIEITTFRRDFNFSGGHSCDVEFVGSILTDMSRRDFTMNAIAVDSNGNVEDPFGGMADIHNRVIRFVGDSNQRIVEDPLRMMRAVRFEAQKNFHMDANAIMAIVMNAHLVENISVERIINEIKKMIVANPLSIITLHEVGILHFIMPEVDILFDTIQNNPHHRFFKVGNHTVNSMMHVDGFVLRFAMLMHDTGKAVTKTTDENGVDHFFGHEHVSAKIAETVMRRMKMDNDTINQVVVLVDNHGRDIAMSANAVKRVINKVGAENFENLIAVKVADDMAKDVDRSDVADRIANANSLVEIFHNVMANAEAFDRSGLVVNGHDMMEIGFVGREIKFVLEHLVDVVIENPDANERENLMEVARNFRNS